MGTLLKTEMLTKKFGGLTAVASVDLRVEQGEIRGLIGPNGSGKTTLFNLLSGVFRTDGGRIEFRGHDITRLPAHQRTSLGMGRTFQVLRLFKKMTVLDNVMVGNHLHMRSNFAEALVAPGYRFKEEVAIKKCRELLQFVGLSGRGKELALNLPYGQQRLLEIARALATDPSLLLLDEPMAGMTQGEIDAVVELIRRIRERGTTVIIIEHAVRAVMAVADRVTVLNFGEKIAEGSPEEVQSNRTVVDAYLGSRR